MELLKRSRYDMVKRSLTLRRFTGGIMTDLGGKRAFYQPHRICSMAALHDMAG